jgi:NAD(P)H dehydrogenase (quinone)
MGAGQETTAFSTLPFFAHMGMIYVSIGGKHKGLSDITQIHGGSAWGAGTVTGPDGMMF